MLVGASNPTPPPKRLESATRVDRRCHRPAEIGQAGDAIARLGDPARHDSGVVREVAGDVEGNAVQRDPALIRTPIAAILSSAARLSLRPAPRRRLLAPLAGDVEGGERADEPFLQRGDESAHVAATALEVEHHVGHTLARP